MIGDSLIFPKNFLTSNCIPLQNRGGFMFFNKMIDESIFSCKLCGCRPGKSREFKNSVGEYTISFSSTTVSIDLNENR